MQRKKVYSLSKLPLLFTFLILVILTTTGSECENLFEPVDPSDITGSWELVGMQGDLQDVCLGEIATFQTNNVALLRCPNSSTFNRQYTYQNGILTYSETGISYNITPGETNNIRQIILAGRNLNRTLTYNRR